jgi:hypothetical protein
MKAKRAKIWSQSLVNRLGGFSAFGFGVRFQAAESERVVVRDVAYKFLIGVGQPVVRYAIHVRLVE